MSLGQKVGGVVLVFALGPILLASSVARGADLLDSTNEYDYIVLSHPTLLAEASRLVTLGQAQGLRTVLVGTDEVGETFGGGGVVDEDAIRQFVLFSAESWAIAPTWLLLVGDVNYDDPTFDGVPTHLTSPSSMTGWADDGWFVAPISEEGFRPLMHVGRIPARTSVELGRYIDKVVAYRSQGAASWNSRLLMLAGDQGIFAEGVAGEVDGLWSWILEHYPWERYIDRASNYTWIPGENCTQQLCSWQEEAQTNTLQAWDAGQGCVMAFGQLYDNPWYSPYYSDLVMLAYFRAAPTFADQLTASSRFPLLVAPTCLTNYFWKTGRSASDRLLLDYADRGAIGSIGSSGLATSVDNTWLSRLFLEGVLDKNLRTPGELLSYMKAEFWRRQLGDAQIAGSYCLLGDPTLRLKMPVVQDSGLENGCEIEDPPVCQSIVSECSSGMLNEVSRLVTLGEPGATVTPPKGERCLRFSAVDAIPSQRDWIEWKVCDASVSIADNTMVSFRLRIEGSPGNVGHISVDGETEAGPLRNDIRVFDQNGECLDAKSRSPREDEWQLLYCDLGPLEGNHLTSLSLRYEADGPGEEGEVVAYLDDLRVWRNGENEEILNGDFENPVPDGVLGSVTLQEGVPDYWYPIPGSLGSFRVERVRWRPASHGRYSVLVADEEGVGQGMCQTLHTHPWHRAYSVSFMACRGSGATSALVRAVDPVDGRVLATRTFPLSTDWSGGTFSFWNPHWGGAWGRVRLEFVPGPQGGSMFVDEVRATGGDVVGVPEEPGLPSEELRVVGVYPNPARSVNSIVVRLVLSETRRIIAELFDAQGRRVVAGAARSLGPGSVSVSLGSLFARPLDSLPWGVYYLRIGADGELAGVRKVVIVQ